MLLTYLPPQALIPYWEPWMNSQKSLSWKTFTRLFTHFFEKRLRSKMAITYHHLWVHFLTLFFTFPFNWTVFCLYKRASRNLHRSILVLYSSFKTFKFWVQSASHLCKLASGFKTILLFGSDQTADKSSKSPNVNTVSFIFIFFTGHMKLMNFINILIKSITAIALQNYVSLQLVFIKIDVTIT